MTSHSERRRRARGAAWIGARLISATLALIGGCGLERPPDPPPFDCATIDRAAERFPDECAEPDDAGPEDAP